MNCGNNCTTASITFVINCVNVSIKDGAKSLTAFISTSITMGKESAMFSTMGTMLLIMPPKDCARLFVSLAISASGLPKPAIKSCHAELKLPIAPVIVSVDSLAKLPAYCSVLSKNICIASVFFSI